jgi:uncharacterized heparinase superfamily protein
VAPVSSGTRVARAVAFAKTVGPHPVALGLAVGERGYTTRRVRRLRRGYADVVADPGERAILRPWTVELCAVAGLPEALRAPSARILREAEDVLAHKVDYLGSGLVQLPREIDWQTDFKSGYTWPVSFYQDVEVTRLSDDSDAKVPWELSRGHQLLTLARAARLFEEERFAAELEFQLAGWLDQNPAGRGINWVNPMEIAIRAVNWVWALGTLEPWRPLDPALRESLARSLQVHGRHIAANLEGNRLLRSNHYLADVLGLLVLGSCLEGDPTAAGWFRFGQRELEREIMKQVLPDGVGFEASLPYHGLALEMFLLAWWVSDASGRPLSDEYRAQLRRMLAVSRSVRHPNGRSPVFGDQDSGRVLPAGFERPATHDNLLDLGSAVLHTPRMVPDGPPHEEVAWTLGLSAWEGLARRGRSSSPPPSAFAAGGLYVINGSDMHVVVRWGDVGQRGNGGHGHNDLSSYELSHGVPFVVDPGTYLYTADPAARNRFRSASAHNVVVVDGLDMHPLPRNALFAMPQHARFEVDTWETTANTTVLAGWHDGYRRDEGLVLCRRRITVDELTNAVEVVDKVTGSGERTVESLLHLAPGCEVRAVGDTDVEVQAAQRRLRFTFTGADSVIVGEDWVSEHYGVRESAPVLRAVVQAELPVRLSYRIVPA